MILLAAAIGTEPVKRIGGALVAPLLTHQRAHFQLPQAFPSVCSATNLLVAGTRLCRVNHAKLMAMRRQPLPISVRVHARDPVRRSFVGRTLPQALCGPKRLVYPGRYEPIFP